MDRAELEQKLVKTAYLEGDFVLASGRRSRYYFDKYLFETQPDLLGAVAELLAARVPPGIRRLAGPELGAIALAAATSIASGLPCLFVRAEAKGYGTAKQIEGRFDPGDPVMLIEDVVTSGGSALAAARALTEAGCEVKQIFGVIDREEGGREAIAAAGYPMDALFTKSDLERWISR